MMKKGGLIPKRMEILLSSQVISLLAQAIEDLKQAFNDAMQIAKNKISIPKDDSETTHSLSEIIARKCSEITKIVDLIIALLNTFLNPGETLDGPELAFTVVESRIAKNWQFLGNNVDPKEKDEALDLIKTLEDAIKSDPQASNDYIAMQKDLFSILRSEIRTAFNSKPAEKGKIKLQAANLDLMKDVLGQMKVNILQNKLKGDLSRAAIKKNKANEKELRALFDSAQHLLERSAYYTTEKGEAEKLSKEIDDLMQKIAKETDPAKRLEYQALLDSKTAMLNKISATSAQEAKEKVASDLTENLKEAKRSQPDAIKVLDKGSIKKNFDDLYILENLSNEALNNSSSTVQDKQSLLSNLKINLQTVDQNSEDIKKVRPQIDSDLDKTMMASIASPCSKAEKNLDEYMKKTRALDLPDQIEIPDVAEIESKMQEITVSANKGVNLDELRDLKEVDKSKEILNLPEQGEIIETARELHTQAKMFESNNNAIISTCKYITVLIVKLQFTIDKKDKSQLNATCKYITVLIVKLQFT